MKKEKWIKKLTVAVLLAALMVSMTGCGGKGGSGSGSKAGDKDLKELVYNAEVLPGMEQIKGDLSSFCVKDDVIYMYTSEWIENKNESGGSMEPEARTADDDSEGDEQAAADDEQQDAMDEAGDADDSEDGGDENDGTDDSEDADDEEGTDDNAADDDSQDDTDTSDDGADDAAETDEAGIDEEYTVDDEYDEFADYSYTVNQYFYSIKSDGSDFKEIFSQLDCGDSNEWLNDFCVAPSGDLYMMYNSYDMEAEQNTYIIRVLDTAGTQKAEIDFSGLLSGEETYLQSMKLDKDGNIYLLADQTVYVLDADGNKVFDVKMESWSSGMANTNEGEVVVSTYGEEKTEIKVIDFAAKGFGKTYQLDMNLYSSNSLISGSGDYTLYYSDSSSVYGYDAGTGKSTELLNWVSSNINASYMNNVQSFTDGKFLGSYYDYSSEDGRSEIYILTKVDPSQVKDKEIITYSGTWVDDSIKAQAVKFNKSQDKYQIVVKDYSNSDDPVTDMNADLIAGNFPDIIDTSGIDIDKYIAKGMLADLYTFMENDSEVKKEDFVENVLKVLETDGKLYHISPTFGINGLIGRAEDVSGRSSFTVDDIIKLEEQYGDGAKAFQSRSNTGVLSSFCSSNFDSYIDWTTGKCSFDSDEFIKILEYANTYPNEDDIDWENSPSLPSSIRERKTIFTDVYSMSMEEIQLYTGIFQDEIGFIGYPSDSQTGVAATFGTDIGIYAKSKNAEGAWEFVKTFLTEEYIGASRYMYYGGFPLRKDALESEIKKNSTTESYTDKYGHEITPLQSTWGYDDVEVEIGPLTDEQVEKLRELIASVDHMYRYNDEISNIISEESGAYFSGQKTAKEVADIIQNRVSTYVNENR